MSKYDFDFVVRVRAEGDDLDSGTAKREAREFIDWFLKEASVSSSTAFVRMVRRSAGKRGGPRMPVIID